MPSTTLRVVQHQTQTLSPRLQHAVRLLQMSSLDFAQTVADTLGRNPFLETEEGDEPAALSPALHALASAPAESRAAAVGEGPSGTGEPLGGDDGEAANDAAPADLGGWQEPAAQGARGDGSEISAMDLVVTPTGLNTHLHGQLNLLPLSPRDMALAKAVVELLDDDGYLRADPFDLTSDPDLDPMASDDEVRIAVRRVQSLDPAGVGARTVQECLLLQSDEIECPRQRALARRILGQHLKLLVSRDAESLARRLREPAAEVEAACARIRRFDPRPGWRFGAPPAPYVTPDVVARRIGKGRWVALLNPAVVPRVRLNHSVVDLFQRHRGAPCPDLASHLQEARWTLRNVEQRFSTIVAVAQAVLDRQRHFLEYGEMAMKPMVLKEIAEAVGVHESTVSRVTSNKYIATPAGVFELKHFFSRAMVMPSGAALSPTAIRGLVRDIIADETHGRPLSDAEITQLLLRQGLSVARRTVTKYRQALKIEPAARRKHA